MKRLTLILLVAFTLLIAVGCDKRHSQDQNTFVPVTSLTVSDNFNWSTSRDVVLDLEVYNNTGNPISNVLFKIYDKSPRLSDAQLLYRGMTDNLGKLNTTINLPTRMTSVVVSGYMEAVTVNIAANRIHRVYGGSYANARKGDFAPPKPSKDFQYLPGYTFDSQGVPSTPPMTFDAVPAGFMQTIAQNFPEGVDIHQTHPEYFVGSPMSLLKVDQDADVWITFLYERAAYHNGFGFYIYDQNHPIHSAADLGPLTIVFPNVKQNDDGGGLIPGDKIHIGVVPGGKYVGYFVVSNGWTGGGNVGAGEGTYYANSSLNPETSPGNQQHIIETQLWSEQYQSMVLGIEDLNRDTGSDNDFNDVVFGVKAQPWSAIDRTGVPPIVPGVDTDGDGVPDVNDDYPIDPDRAFNNYTPGENTWGSLVYEDLWPAYGDYDLNDMVVDYRVNQVTNAQNHVKDIDCTWRLRAVGASYNNGFAFELPFSAADISSVTSNHSLWTLESGGSKAVVRVFNNTFDLIPQVPGHFINTEIGQPYHTPVEVTTNITLTNALDPNLFNHSAPYNPFIFVRGVRSHEVHLKDYAPTSQMDMALFGTGNDNSNPATGRYFVSKDNLPWAFNIAAEFDYPTERTMITHAYYKFAPWAQSSGNSYPDWYMNNPGYRDAQYIYQH